MRNPSDSKKRCASFLYDKEGNLAGVFINHTTNSADNPIKGRSLTLKGHDYIYPPGTQYPENWADVEKLLKEEKKAQLDGTQKSSTDIKDSISKQFAALVPILKEIWEGNTNTFTHIYVDRTLSKTRGCNISNYRTLRWGGRAGEEADGEDVAIWVFEKRCGVQPVIPLPDELRDLTLDEAKNACLLGALFAADKEHVEKAFQRIRHEHDIRMRIKGTKDLPFPDVVQKTLVAYKQDREALVSSSEIQEFGETSYPGLSVQEKRSFSREAFSRTRQTSSNPER